MTGPPSSWFRRRERELWWAGLALVTLGGLAWRLALAARSPRLPDEDICLGIAQSILRPSAAWPLHGGDHPLLGVYLLAASAALFGPSLLGFRLLGAIAGGVTPLVVGLAVARSGSRREAIVAAALLAANPLHAGLSGLAFEIPFQLLFATLAWWRLAAWPDGGRRALLWASAFLGLAFLCSESAALLAVGWALALLARSDRRRGFGHGDILAAAAMFLAVISVDVFHNLTATRVDFAYVNYLDHARRIAHPSLSLQGVGFFLRDLFNALIADRPSLWADYRCEYPGPGVAMGILLLLGAMHGLAAGGDPSRGLWSVPTLLFVLVTTFLGPAGPGDLDPPIWTWPLPSLPLVAASTARMLTSRWRSFWPLLPAILASPWLVGAPPADVCR